jgi:threonylcarbamoyladenosine tRNA methylthiotransferase MtaB
MIVNSNIRSKRNKLLRLLSNRKAAFYNINTCTIYKVLFESEDSNGFIEGFSSNYLRFRRKLD